MKQNGLALQFVNPTFRADRKIPIEALKQNSLAIEWLAFSHKQDVDLALHACRQNKRSLECVPSHTYLPKCLYKAAESAVAVTGEEAPVITIEIAPVKGHPMTRSVTGENYNLNLDNTADWNATAPEPSKHTVAAIDSSDANEVDSVSLGVRPCYYEHTGDTVSVVLRSTPTTSFRT